MALNLGGLLAVLSMIIGSTLAINCYTCLSNKTAGQDCRSITNQSPISCPADSKHCVAVVLGTAQGEITVNRGCGNHVQNFNLGDSECSMLDSFGDDLPAAYYKCKTDGCNNIEPITAEVTEVVKSPVKSNHPPTTNPGQ